MSISIPIKPIVYLHGEPTVRFEKKEVEVMIHQQELNLAVIGKFSHGWPEIGLLRTLIPKQCGLKAEVNIGLLCDRHVLIRCTIAEDYDTLMSRQTFEIKEKNKPYLMRTFKWDVTFNPEEETRFAYGWISFPGLPPHFHGESSLFSMAASVGKPISIDSATRNKTRPSSARVKVEVDLLQSHPKSVLIQVGEGAEITSTQQRIRYDFLPKYCTNCKLQGHDAIGCWKLNPELRPNKGNPAVAGGLTAAGGEKSKSQHPTHPPLSSTSHPTNSEWQSVNHRRKTNGKGNPNPPQNTKNPSSLKETPIPATGTVKTTSLAVGNTVQATENTILQKNTFFEISDAGNPTGILGGAGNPTGTLGGAGNPTGTLPAPSPVQVAHPPETLAVVVAAGPNPSGMAQNYSQNPNPNTSLPETTTSQNPKPPAGNHPLDNPDIAPPAKPTQNSSPLSLTRPETTLPKLAQSQSITAQPVTDQAGPPTKPGPQTNPTLPTNSNPGPPLPTRETPNPEIPNPSRNFPNPSPNNPNPSPNYPKPNTISVQKPSPPIDPNSSPISTPTNSNPKKNIVGQTQEYETLEITGTAGRRQVVVESSTESSSCMAITVANPDFVAALDGTVYNATKSGKKPISSSSEFTPKTKAPVAEEWVKKAFSFPAKGSSSSTSSSRRRRWCDNEKENEEIEASVAAMGFGEDKSIESISSQLAEAAASGGFDGLDEFERLAESDEGLLSIEIT
ncbi:hypothetical protein RND71_004435 [Anisodus tanguticus]|uniref:DUF4283 domain-containing protein n=1 Tax=Anisodus tanguticus TaxID=243964 RepID=A0AAE1SQI8_9SOLA|nr:hypothetical protein RND71_004435 [Anisodus tanguticus]